jgi:hypothetical protein
MNSTKYRRKIVIQIITMSQNNKEHRIFSGVEAAGALG